MQAQQLMLEALNDANKRRFFQKKRLQQGYKTLRGCMMAYYIDHLMRQEQEEEQRKTSEKMREILRDVVENVVIANIGEEERSVLGERLEECELRNILGDGEMSFGTVDRDIGDG